MSLHARSAPDALPMWCGLNGRQIGLVVRAMPERQCYRQSAGGNRLFEVGRVPVALGLCGASDPESQRLIDRVLAEHGSADFASNLLVARDLAWAADLLASVANPPAEPNPKEMMS